MKTRPHCYRMLPARRAERLVTGLAALCLLITPFLTGRLPAQESGPRQGITFWLLDDNGNWKVPLPNWSIDDVTALLDQRKQSRNTTSAAIDLLNIDGEVIQTSPLVVNGEVTGQRALLNLEYKISLTLSGGSSLPVRIPLGMKEGVFRAGDGAGETNFTFEGPGRVLLDVDAENGGYAALIYPDQETAPEPDPAPSEEDASEQEPADRAIPDPAGGESAAASGESPSKPESSPSTQNYTVRLRLLFPVQQASGSEEHSLSLTPPAAIRSQARLTVPLPDVEIGTSEGLIADAPVNLDEKSSEIKVYGFNRGGAVTAIRWRPAKKNEASLPVTYQIEKAAIDLTPTGSSVDYDIRLPIRVFGGAQSPASRDLKIELPAGARVDMEKLHAAASDGSDIPDVVYREIPPTEMDPNPGVGVMIPGDVDALTLRLTASVPNTEKNTWECTGFHLEGALKETGEITVHLPDDENILPDLVPVAGLRDIPQTDTAEGAEKRARFRFYKGEFILKSVPIQRESHVIAQPEFQVLVGENELHLKTRVAYSVYGAPLREVRVKNHEWFIAKFDDESNIDAANIHDDPQSKEVKILPLKKPVEGDFVLKWESVCSVDDVRSQESPAGPSIEFGFPEIIADWAASPLAAIVPDDNIELIPHKGKNEDLTQAAARPLIELPRRQQQPFLYQVQKYQVQKQAQNEGDAAAPRPLFSARFLVHKEEVSVRSALSVRLDRTPAESVQTLEYNIKYKPVSSLDFRVPQELESLPDLEILLDGKAVSFEKRISTPEDQDSGLQSRLIRLPAPGRIGPVRLEIRTPLELHKIGTDLSNIINIPLAVPVPSSAEPNASGDGNRTEPGTSDADHYSVEAVGPLNWTLHVPETASLWEKTDDSQTSGTRLFRFRYLGRKADGENTPSFPSLFPLRIDVDSLQDGGGLTAEQIWAQTVMGTGSYYEAIRCRLSGNRRLFTLRLPEGARADQIAVAVDGVPIPVDYTPEERELRVPLPETVKSETAVVSLWYQIPRSEHKLEFPDLMEKTMIRRCLLQLVLPPKTVLRQTPQGWSSEYDEFNREESMGDFTAAMGEDALPPPKNANIYLLSSFSPPAETHLKMINRAALVMIGSGLILLLGSIYLYLPRLRHYELFPVLVLLAAAIVLFRPAVVFYYTQYCAFGFILILVILLIKTQTERRRAARPLNPPSALHGPVQPPQKSDIAQDAEKETHPSGTVPPETVSPEEKPAPGGDTPSATVSAGAGAAGQPDSPAKAETGVQIEYKQDIPAADEQASPADAEQVKGSEEDSAAQAEAEPETPPQAGTGSPGAASGAPEAGSTETKPVPEGSSTEDV